MYVLYTYDHILGSGGVRPALGRHLPDAARPDDRRLRDQRPAVALRRERHHHHRPEQVLIEDWCQQFPSHSIGSLTFGPDGALYVSGGDGASFNVADYGQSGGTRRRSPTPMNPCGDPPNDGDDAADRGGRRPAQPGHPDAARRSALRTATRSSADGPVAYWRLGESTGTTADRSARDAAPARTAARRPTASPGALGGRRRTQRSRSRRSRRYVRRVPDATASTSANGPFTVEFWFKPTTSVGHAPVVLSKGSQFAATNGDAANLTIDNDNTADRLGADAVLDGIGWPIDASWHHFVVTQTRTATATKLYLDGVEHAVTNFERRLRRPADHRVDRGATARSYSQRRARRGRGLQQRPDADPGRGPLRRGVRRAATADPSRRSTARSSASTRPRARACPATRSPRSADPNARRIIAYGLRNPFRITLRPGTNELWVGDVGWNTWEEINRIPNATDATPRTSAGRATRARRRQSGYDGAEPEPVRERCMPQGRARSPRPYYTYNHARRSSPATTCPTGSSSITGLAFYPESGGSFPAAYHGGAVLRRPQPQLHLVHAQGRQRPARPRPASSRSSPARPTRSTS